MNKTCNKILNMWKHELTNDEKEACSGEANGWLYIIDLFIEKHPECSTEVDELLHYEDENDHAEGFTIDSELERLCITLQQSLYNVCTAITWVSTLYKLPEKDGLYLVVTSSGSITELSYSTVTRCFNGASPIPVAFWAKRSANISKICDEAWNNRHLLDNYDDFTQK